MPPPLAQGHAQARDTAAIESWFATWEGPIEASEHDFTLKIGGDIAYARALRRMTGKKKDGKPVDRWFRSTIALEQLRGKWKITHLHDSVPMAMDGSDKALLDLTP